MFLIVLVPLLKVTFLYKIQWIVPFRSITWQISLPNLSPIQLSLVKLPAAYFWYFLRQMQCFSTEKFFRKTSWSHSFMQTPIDWSFFYCTIHCVKSVHIRCYSVILSILSPNAGKYGKNTDQNNSEYRHFLLRNYRPEILTSKVTENKFITNQSFDHCCGYRW